MNDINLQLCLVRHCPFLPKCPCTRDLQVRWLPLLHHTEQVRRFHSTMSFYPVIDCSPMFQFIRCGSILCRIIGPLILPHNYTIDLFLLQEKLHFPWPLRVLHSTELHNWYGGRSYREDININVGNYTLLLITTCLQISPSSLSCWFVITKNTMRPGLWPVGPILVQRKAYVNFWCSCHIGDAYTDLSIHLFDMYTRSGVNAALPFNSNTTWWPHSNSALQQWHSKDSLSRPANWPRNQSETNHQFTARPKIQSFKSQVEIT